MNSMLRRCPAASVVAAAVTAVLMSATAGRAQEAPTEAQQEEYLALAGIVGAALKGEIVPAGEPFGWANDFLKSSERNTFVPFTLSIEQSKLGTSSAAMYLFATREGGRAAAGVGGAAPTLPTAAFEDAYHVSFGAPTDDGAYLVRRAFSVPAGRYDIYVALSESGVPDGAEPRTMMLKKTLSVPDMWSNRLSTSTVILTAGIESLAEPLPPEQQLANPYTMGTMRIVPKDDPVYLPSDDFSWVFLIYNVGLADSGMPDVSVEYTFNTRGPSGGVFFNRTDPQEFNAQTLPPGFDFTGGHQLVGGQALSLSEFPAADYRLEIEVTDNTNGASLFHTVDFTVSAF